MVATSSCGACRYHKKRCDRTEPECGHCLRIGRKCPGYRDSSSLIFRVATPRSMGRNVRRKGEVGLLPFRTPPKSVSPAATSVSDEQDAGMKHFLAHYAVPDEGAPMGFGDHAVKLLQQREDDEGPLYAAVQAVGLARLASTRGDKALLKEACNCYGNALRKVKAAILDPAERIKDSTVIATFVLGIYESITCTDDEPLDSWSAHIDGAVSIILGRGSAQFSTPDGLGIFQIAIAHLLIRCARVHRPLPTAMRILRAEAAPLVKPDDLFWATSSAYIEALDLSHASRRTPRDPEALLVRALELDARLASRMASPPPGWTYVTLHDPVADPRLVHAAVYHIYPSLHVAKVWSDLFSCRILLANLTLRLVRDGGIYPEQEGPAQARLVAMRDDLLASVPQMLGYVRRHGSGQGLVVGEPEGGETNFGASLGSFFLLWHLFTVARLTINSDATKAWVVQRLRLMKATTGMAKAGFLADVLEREIQKGGETDEGKKVEERGVALKMVDGEWTNKFM